MIKFYQKRKRYIIFGTIAFVILFTALFYKVSIDPKKTQTFVQNILKETLPLISNVDNNEPKLFEYISVTDSCGPSYNGACVNVRSGPGVNFPVMFKLRNGIVLKVEDEVTEGKTKWYKITFKDEWLRYPERVSTDLYVSSDYVTSFFDEGNKESSTTTNGSNKRIVVDRSEQVLYAYEDDVLFMKEKVSTGIELTPTPRGNFTVFKKSPSRYMQGPIPGISDHYYDLPGVPWNLYFTEQGAVIHGAYWHNNFGQVWSNGCVNLPIESAEKLYKWADVGTKILIRD